MNNISPIDGRYQKYTEGLNDIFSEAAFIKQRTIVEIRYFLFLLNLNTHMFPMDRPLDTLMRELQHNITDQNIIDIKAIENNINHDVKSIEYFLAKVLKDNDYPEYVNLLHFGLTSQDVNTMVYSLSLKNYSENIFNTVFNNMTKSLESKIMDWSKIVILGRTHGQPASWTILGKEFNVFYCKLLREYNAVKTYKFTTKFSGAVGNMTSHKLLYNVSWPALLDDFVKTFDLDRTSVTTQIHNYNEYAQYFDGLKRICSILVDMCTDIWLYCSLGELTLKKPKEHVGSSIMPHKVNPIEFENAEGNLKIAEMWLEFMSRELCKSRLQRDLTDSTILRNLGTMFGHILIGLRNINRGFSYLEANLERIDANLYNNIESMSEVEQHLLRIENKEDGYKAIKNKTDNEDKDKEKDKDKDKETSKREKMKYYKELILR